MFLRLKSKYHICLWFQKIFKFNIFNLKLVWYQWEGHLFFVKIHIQQGIKCHKKHRLFRNPGRRNVKLIETIKGNEQFDWKYSEWEKELSTKDSPLHQSLTTHPHDRFQLQQTRQISNCITHSNLTPYSFILLGPITTSHYQRLYIHLRQEENNKDNNWMINPFIPIIIFSFPLPFPILPNIWNHSRSSGICKTHPKLWKWRDVLNNQLTTRKRNTNITKSF